MNTADQWLFGLDLDGTTLSPMGSVTPRTVAAIRNVLVAGHRVAFATGRNFVEAQTVFEATGHRDLAVLVSGAVVVDTRTGHSVRRSTMNSVLAAELCGAIEAMGHAAVAYQDRVAGEDYLVSAGLPVHGSLEMWLSLSGQRRAYRNDLSAYGHEHTFRISTILPSAEAARLTSKIENEFAGRAYVHRLGVHNQDFEFVEIFDPRVNKWQGLLDVADLHGVDASRIVAIGDDQNDLPMLRQAPIGVAMGNARDEAKAATCYVAASNAEDGLAQFLEACVARSPADAAEAIRTPRR